MRATISLTVDTNGDIVQTRTEVDVPIARENADRAVFVRWRAGTPCRTRTTPLRSVAAPARNGLRLSAHPLAPCCGKMLVLRA